MNFLYNDNDEMIMIQPSMKWKWKIKKWVLYFRLGTQTYSLLLYYYIYMVKRGFSSTFFFICSRIQESKVYLSFLFVCLFVLRVNHRNYFYFYLSFFSLKFILLSSILIFSSLLKRLKTERLNNINKKTTLL